MRVTIAWEDGPRTAEQVNRMCAELDRIKREVQKNKKGKCSISISGKGVTINITEEGKK